MIVGIAQAPHVDQANATFASFLERIQVAGVHAALDTSAFWTGQLEDSLSQLSSIEAREVFERHIAGLLVQGWRPGHEMLLVAAAAIFNWKEDRPRLQTLGTAGATLNRALEEHATFSRQTELMRRRQSQLITRLRDPAPPSTRELLGNLPMLEQLQAAYGNWLSIITNANAIAQWQQAYQALPFWRRRLWRGKWKWLWVVLIVGLIRMFAQFGSETPKPPPVPKQQPAVKPKLSGDYLREGDAHLERGEFNEAIESYSDLLDLTPNNFMAWIGRGTAYLGLGDDLQAERDFNQSAVLDNDNHALYTARGKLAAYRQHPADAIALYTKALAMLPQGDYNVLTQRAAAYEQAGDYDNAQKDIYAAILGAREPISNVYLYSIRLALVRGDMTAADAEANTMLSKFGDLPEAYENIASMYSTFGNKQQALAVLERGIKTHPSANLWLIRSQLRSPNDLQNRRADLARASTLAPDSFQVVQARVDLELNAGNQGAAADLVTQAIKQTSVKEASWSQLLALRGVVTALRGNRPAAEQDFSDALKASDNAWKINNVCWLLATHNVSLPTALYICDQGLEQEPDRIALLDSKGLVLLRMGRNQDALAAYEAALARRINYPHSLMGRGIARLRLGDQAGGEADIKAALKAHPSLQQDYASYGVQPYAK